MKYAIPLLFITLALVGCGKPTGSSRVTKTPEASTFKSASSSCCKTYKGNIHEDYHVIVFGYSKGVRQNHTFATWVRSRNKEIIEQVDISWNPKDADGLGSNKCLGETLNDAQGSKLNYWVLRTDRTFFEAAQIQRDNLALHRCFDSKTQSTSVDCVQACSHIAGGLDYVGTGIGASQKVAELYVANGKAWPSDDDWIIPLLLKTWNCSLR
jgi:hypothetical protein